MILAAALVTSVAGGAEAQTQCDGEGHPVLIVFAGDGWVGPLRSRIVAELSGALVPQGFSPCLGGARDAVAEIQLHAETPNQVIVSIEVWDEVTQKRLTRDVDLTALPEDSRALALAVASDELLRASWLELAVADRSPTAAAAQSPPPPEVQHVVERALESGSGRWTEIGARFAVEAFSLGETHLGADAYATTWLTDWFALELSVEARRGLGTESANGSVVATSFGGSSAGIVRIVNALPWWLGLGARFRAAYLAFEGTPNAGRLGFRRETLLLGARGEATLGFAAGSFVARATVGVGAPWTTGAATDDGARVSAAGGVELSAQLGIGLRL